MNTSTAKGLLYFWLLAAIILLGVAIRLTFVSGGKSRAMLYMGAAAIAFILALVFRGRAYRE